MEGRNQAGFRSGLLILILVLAAGATACVARTPAITAPSGIASLEKVKLGGVEQWVLIRGQDVKDPVLLFVHGGPGSPETPMERVFGRGLEKHFVLVMWDQRGAGKSYHPGLPPASMNVRQFIEDTHELTLRLRERFHVEKIYLVGHSWGSLLGALTVQQYPDLYYAYVGIGQVVDLKRNEEISYRFVLAEARKRHNLFAIQQLTMIGPPPYSGIAELATQRYWLSQFGGAIYKKESSARTAAAPFQATEYTALDFIKYLIGEYFSIKHMWPEVLKYNLIEQVPRLELPVYFFEGRHDYNTPWELVQEYYDKLEAPKGKQLIWFEDSAHSPNLEEPEKFAEMMVTRVKAETLPK